MVPPIPPHPWALGLHSYVHSCQSFETALRLWWSRSSYHVSNRTFMFMGHRRGRGSGLQVGSAV
jgi:hypothetical protein